MSDLKDLNKKKITELVGICDELSIDNSGKKNELIERIIDFHSSYEKKKKPPERVKRDFKKTNHDNSEKNVH